MRRTILTLLFAGAAPWAFAQGADVQTRPAAPDGLVEIENPSGRITVVGWDRDEIQVGGQLGRDVELDFEVSGSHARIEVDTHGRHHGHGAHSDLEVHVPRRSRLEIDASTNASVEVSGVTGRVSAETVNGGISVEGTAEEADVETVNGDVEIRGRPRWVRAESVNGRVLIEGAGGEVEATTVNGRLEVTGGSTFERARLEIVNGRVIFEGELSDTALLEIESVSGDVELVLPESVAADFRISSFSGEIRNDFGPAAERTSRWTTEKELRFSNAGGGAKVEVHTLSGNVSLRKR